jgi:hypothetical protein
VAHWLLNTYPGKKLRLYSADNTDPLEPYIDAGVIEVIDVALPEHSFEAIDNACNGFVPKDPKDPHSVWVPTKDWGDIVAVAYEGLSVFSDMLMRTLAEQMGDKKRIGPGTRPGEDGISFKDGTYGVGGNTQTHYGLVQKEMYKNVKNSGKLPIHVFWTGHTVKAMDENKPIFGPQLAGLKQTPYCQRWFGAMLHCHTVPTKSGVEYRLYLKEHYDPAISTTAPYKAVTRVPLPLLDPKIKSSVEAEWDKVIPEYYNWTNDCSVMSKYMALRAQLRVMAKNIILKQSN